MAIHSDMNMSIDDSISSLRLGVCSLKEYDPSFKPSPTLNFWPFKSVPNYSQQSVAQEVNRFDSDSPKKGNLQGSADNQSRQALGEDKLEAMPQASVAQKCSGATTADTHSQGTDKTSSKECFNTSRPDANDQEVSS